MRSKGECVAVLIRIESGNHHGERGAQIAFHLFYGCGGFFQGATVFIAQSKDIDGSIKFRVVLVQNTAFRPYSWDTKSLE